MNAEIDNIASKGRTPWRGRMQLRPVPSKSRQEPEIILMGLVGDMCFQSPPEGISQKYHIQEAYRRLEELCLWLHDELDRPLKVRKLAQQTYRVEVLRCVAYTIDPVERTIATGKIIKRKYKGIECNFEIGHPMRTPWWLEFILEDLDLSVDPDGDLFFTAEEAGELNNWLTTAAYRLLLKDLRFQKLRKQLLPNALNLPRDTFGIALACRTHPVGPLLESWDFNIVWDNHSEFRQVARENPQLLPLLLLVTKTCAHQKLPKDIDPIAFLKKMLRCRGVSEASWKYLVRYGARIFKHPWSITSGQSALDVVIIYLKALQTAGLPPPPPPSVVKALLHSYNAHSGHEARLKLGFESSIDPSVLRTGLIESDIRRHKPGLRNFTEELLGVFWWSENLESALDSNQVKAGWKKFVREWMKAEAVRKSISQDGFRCWVTRFTEFTWRTYKVIPIETSVELLNESIAMRNCLKDYVDEAEEGEVEIYSVRDKETGKRKACIGFRFDEQGWPSIFDIKSFANTPPKSEIESLAEWMLKDLDKSRAFAELQKSKQAKHETAHAVNFNMARVIDFGVLVFKSIRSFQLSNGLMRLN